MKQPEREREWKTSLFYLQYVRNDVFLTLFEKRVFVKGGVCLHDLRQHLRHFCLREKTTWKKKTEGRKINSRNTFIYEINSQHEVCLLLSATQWGDSTSYGGALPRKSVTLSVIALDALMRALSLSSYFIFISKNPVRNNRRQTFFHKKYNSR